MIYLFSYNKFYSQYVGETQQRLRRLDIHGFGFKHPEIYGHCCILAELFNAGFCKNALYNMQIFEKNEGSDRTERRIVDPSTPLGKEIYVLDVKAPYCFSKWLE